MRWHVPCSAIRMRLLPLALTGLLACSSSDPEGTPAPEPDAGPRAAAPRTLSDATSRRPPYEIDAATIRVHYPHIGSQVVLRADAPLDLTLPCVASSDAACDVQVDRFPSGAKALTLHVVRDGVASKGPAYVVARHEQRDLYPHFVSAQGTRQKLFASFHSEILNAKEPANARIVWAYLPASYAENTEARYPVAYLHDGANLFEASESITGVEWQVDETVEQGWEHSGAFGEFVVIGIEQFVMVNGVRTNQRQGEYNPAPNPLAAGSPAPAGNEYVDALANELKPQVDRALRTLPGPETTATLGSSLGATISMWAAARHPEVFGTIGVLSAANATDNAWLEGQLSVLVRPAGAGGLDRLYFDMGTNGDTPALWSDLVRLYRAKGYADGSSLVSLLDVNGTHSETAWARRLPTAFAALFPDRRHP